MLRTVVSVWTPLKLLEWTTERFAKERIESARLEAQLLLAHALHCDRVQLYTNFDKPLGEPELAAYRELVRRRLAGEPVAYLVERREFWSMPLLVDARVLIPRPDTETLVEVALNLISDHTKPVTIADIGTGSGAVALALATELPAACIVAADVSAGALEVAQANAAALGFAERVRFVCGEVLQPVVALAPIDMIVSNPPYIPTADIAGLAADVRREPTLALDGGVDGLAIMRRLVRQAPKVLREGGWVAVEHGADQGPAVAAIFDDVGCFTPAALHRDLAGRPRVTVAQCTRHVAEQPGCSDEQGTRAG